MEVAGLPENCTEEKDKLANMMRDVADQNESLNKKVHFLGEKLKKIARY